MASATGIPDARIIRDEDLGEDEPLLGRIGDASQHATQPLHHNLIIGTAVVAQAGVVLLVATVWANVFLHPLMLFSAHPLLNSTALFSMVQAILILQPTHTTSQKRRGTLAHFSFNMLAIDLLLAGLVIIEYNKIAHGGLHFRSPHAILGLITYVLIFTQAIVGSTAYFLPRVYGSENAAKAIYKWHRMSGYLVLLLILATVVAATQTDYNKNVLHIRLWSTLVAAVLVLVGIIPRIKKQKLGLKPRRVLDSGAFGQ